MKIFIVGGSSGIGLSLAKRYVNLGNEVAICGTNEEKLKKIEENNKENSLKTEDKKVEEIKDKDKIDNKNEDKEKNKVDNKNEDKVEQ